MPIFQLTDEIAFPPPKLANQDGMLAIGGDLSPQRLLLAYQMGIFPWYGEGEPIIWWSLSPRCILYPKDLKISKSMKQVLRKEDFTVSFDTAFREVIGACQKINRKDQFGTWITDDMLEAYCELHHLGWGHSVEVWDKKTGELIGGLYGISIGSCFFGESMFANKSNMSKVAFLFLVKQLEAWNFQMIDCQQVTQHLQSLGARKVPRVYFLKKLEKIVQTPSKVGQWTREIESVL